jgi:hypothetical protein
VNPLWGYLKGGVFHTNPLQELQVEIEAVEKIT